MSALDMPEPACFVGCLVLHTAVLGFWFWDKLFPKVRVTTSYVSKTLPSEECSCLTATASPILLGGCKDEASQNTRESCGCFQDFGRYFSRRISGKIRGRKGTPKELARQDFAELSGAFCFKILLQGIALKLFRKSFCAVRAIFWLLGFVFGLLGKNLENLEKNRITTCLKSKDLGTRNGKLASQFPSPNIKSPLQLRVADLAKDFHIT